MIGNLIMPKRGKGLLSKNAIKGDIPVVAGGIEPATYHNQANTTAPVLTIAASGANAGYINLWHIPVWASDSSYIDDSITPNVYFWYIMLKKRQKEIFDAQVGSAQPHIYPKHIAELPMNVVFVEKIAEYNEIVTPIFEKKGQLYLESKRLTSLRDTLLPKLMSGELKINDITTKFPFMEELTTYTLEEISIGKGTYGIGAPAIPFDKNKRTYLRITDINEDGTLNKDGLMSVEEEKADEYLLAPNDIVFARTGNSTGRTYFYEESDGIFCYAGFLIKFTLNPNKVNPRMLKYYTHSKAYYDWVHSFDTGGTRGNINAKTYGQMP